LKLEEIITSTDPSKSRPLRARGLKPAYFTSLFDLIFVAPPAGAWIETIAGRFVSVPERSRAPCGRVD